MAEAVQLVGTVAGAYVGGLVGMPMLGAAIGGALGGLVGQELFGKTVNGPRIDQFRATGSAVGTPMARGYGNNRIAGELMWFGRVRTRTRTKKVGGIGGFGGTKVKSYEYYGDFAIALQEGPDVCLRKIKIQGEVWWQQPGEAAGNPDYLDQQRRLLEFGPDDLTAEELAQYNASARSVAASQGRNEFFTFYPGSETQEPDPIIQQYLGDAAPAYRGTAYVVFKNLPLTEYGGSMPLIEFETVSGPTQDASQALFWLPQTISNWNAAGADPRDPTAAHEYRYIKQAVASDTGPLDPPWRSTLAEAFDDFADDTGFEADQAPVLMGWSYRPSSAQYSWEMRPYEGDVPGDREILNLHFNDFEPSEGFFPELEAGIDDSQRDCRAVNTKVEVDDGKTVWWGDSTEFDVLDADKGENIGIYYRSTSGTNTELSPRGRNNNSCPGTGGGYLKLVPDVIVQVRRVPSCPPSTCDGKQSVPENSDYCLDADGNVLPALTYSETSEGTFVQLALLTVDGLDVVQAPLGPVLNLDDPDSAASNTEEFWEPHYLAAVAIGDAEAGWTFDASGEGGDGTYPRIVETVCAGLLDHPQFCEAVAVSVADVIEAEASRCVPLVLADLHTSLVTDTIWGIKYLNNPSGRDAIEQLRAYSFLDAVDGPQLKFVPRGLPAVATLTNDDLGAHEYGGQRPPMLEVTRVDDIQLPREVRVSYVDQNADFQPGQQYDRRLVTDAVNVQSIELAIVMSGDDGKRIATVSLYDQWAGRKALEFALGPRWLMLEPTDCIEIPDLDGVTRVRIDRDDLALPGLRKMQGVRDEISLYDRTPTGPTPQIPDVADDTPVIQGPTTTVILDLPTMGLGDADAGYWVAFYGVLDTWQSAEGFRSLDAGTTYDGVVDAGSAIAGVVVTPYDETEITVRVYGGVLLSTTAAAAAAGTNRFAVGVAGRWVIGTFETVVDNGEGEYTLSDLTMGLFNTEWAIGPEGSPSEFLGVAGDAFVMLETASRVAEEDSIVGDTVLFRPVTSGTVFENGTDQSFTARGNGRGFVVSFGADTPPAHSSGATHVAGTAPTGEWMLYPDYIVHDVDDTWYFELPEDGRQVRTAAGLLYTYTAGSPGFWSLTASGGLQDGDAGDVEVSGGGTVITITKGLAPYVRGAGWDSASEDALVAADCKEVNVFCPTAGTITRWTLLTEGGTGSCEIDVWKRAYASGAPDIANTITGTGTPSITSGTRAQSTDFSLWTSTAVASGDVLTFAVLDTSGFTAFNLMLEITPS